jgi:L-ribulose-5-phosphate 4-epimerase
MTDDVAAVRAEVVRVARLLRERGLAIGTSGNVGARLADGRIAITPSTMDYEDMTADDIVIVEADGAPSEGGHRPSSELRIHLGVFAARPDVRAIVHGHSPFATALASALGRAERVEELAMLAWRAEQIGGATLLDADELDRVREQMARFPRQGGGR